MPHEHGLQVHVALLVEELVQDEGRSFWVLFVGAVARLMHRKANMAVLRVTNEHGRDGGVHFVGGSDCSSPRRIWCILSPTAGLPPMSHAVTQSTSWIS